MQLRVFEVWRKSSISKNKGWNVISVVKGIWSGVKITKGGEGRELGQGGMCSVYKGSEVKVLVKCV
jgi:hypothetical protein